MKRVLPVFLIMASLLGCTIASDAQIRSNSNPSTSAGNNSGRADDLNRQAGILNADGEEPEMPLRPLPEIRKEARERIKVTDQEREQFRAALGDKKANIVKIVSSFSCNSSLVINVGDPRCLENPDISVVSYYSFRAKDYSESPWTDISLSEGEMTAGNKWHTVGALADLGESLEFSKVDPLNESVKAMWAMEAPETLEQKSKLKIDLEKGIAIGDLKLSSKKNIEVNHIYLLRTTSYRLEASFNSGFGGGFNWNNTDSLFAIKVLAIGPDKTATIAWKRLMQRVAPVLKDKEEKK